MDPQLDLSGDGGNPVQPGALPQGGALQAGGADGGAGRPVRAQHADLCGPHRLCHKLPGWEDLLRLRGQHQVPALEADFAALHHLHVLLHLLRAGRGADVLQHARGAGGVSEPGVSRGHEVLQGHGHAGPLLSETHLGHATD